MKPVFRYKKRLLNYLKKHGWYVNLSNNRYAVMYCWNCCVQRHHKLMDIEFIKIPERWVSVGVFRCTYCYEHGVAFRDVDYEPIY